MTRARLAAILFAAVVVCGCHESPPPASPQDAARIANHAFITQKTFDPWILSTTEPLPSTGVYLGDGKLGEIAVGYRKTTHLIHAGDYLNGQLRDNYEHDAHNLPQAASSHERQSLNMRTGNYEVRDAVVATTTMPSPDWVKIWNTTDIAIANDPEAQQITHANLFYLLSSTYPGSDHSIPPMGLSSTAYGGHIFWDADVWMLPALIVQHPEYAKPIVDYRFKLLAQAKRNAAAHGYPGAEFPWESADAGTELAPPEFAQERHVTADAAFAAWTYYLWTADRAFLRHEAWPLLKATADYWTARATKQNPPSKAYDILHVLSPDETAGVVDNDAYTNAAARFNLRAAVKAARLLHYPANPQWNAIAATLTMPYDRRRQIVQENSRPMSERFRTKQADALLLIHPLDAVPDAGTQSRMLEFYVPHTIKTGPAMTDSIHAIVAARLGRSQQSLDFFRASYRPFERAPWDAFSEKRTTNNVYFLTGMAGCVQVVLYGFAGLNVAESGAGRGVRLSGDSVASLYAAPCLPPGWGALQINGVKFRGKTLKLFIVQRADGIGFILVNGKSYTYQTRPSA